MSMGLSTRSTRLRRIYSDQIIAPCFDSCGIRHSYFCQGTGESPPPQPLGWIDTRYTVCEEPRAALASINVIIAAPPGVDSGITISCPSGNVTVNGPSRRALCSRFLSGFSPLVTR
jgi:hypothetical protein